MLYSVDSQLYVNKIPHREFFEACRKRLTNEEYDAIVVELNNRIKDAEYL